MKVITKQTRSYSSSSRRECAIKLLRKRGFNYFVCFIERQLFSSSFGLQYAKAGWLQKGESYVHR